MVQFIKKFLNNGRKRGISKRGYACVVQAQKLEVRKQILFHVRGELYFVFAICPICKRNISDAEVVEFFSKKPITFTVKMDCPNPECNFVGVRPFIEVNKVKMPFYSPYVSRKMLKKLFLQYKPEDIKGFAPKLFHSVIFNFGSLRNAFALKGYEYKYPEIPGWETGIKRLPDNIPDSVVSECFGVSLEEVQRIRR